MSRELTKDTFLDWADKKFDRPSDLLDLLWELDQDVYWDVYYVMEKNEEE